MLEFVMTKEIRIRTYLWRIEFFYDLTRQMRIIIEMKNLV